MACCNCNGNVYGGTTSAYGCSCSGSSSASSSSYSNGCCCCCNGRETRAEAYYRGYRDGCEACSADEGDATYCSCY